jgi:nucleoid-associated protein YgaU
MDDGCSNVAPFLRPQIQSPIDFARTGDHLPEFPMKSRLSLIIGAFVLLFVTICVVCDRNRAPAIATAAALPATPIRPIANPIPPLAALPMPSPIPKSDDLQTPPTQLVKVAKDGSLNYTARYGDTVSQLAAALLGSDSKSNRQVVIAANPSLTKNPDRVLNGQDYTVPATTDQPAEAPSATDGVGRSIPPVSQADATNPPSTDAPHELKYTAQHGDSVSALAANLLGGDTVDNRKTIIGSNASLQGDSNRLVAGKTYTIVTTGGLAAAPPAANSASPTSPEDDDDAATNQVGRELRYTAQPGDTLSKLATVLLGADTKANRALITDSNPSLKQNPDRLVAGQTYWIAAPATGLAP